MGLLQNQRGKLVAAATMLVLAGAIVSFQVVGCHPPVHEMPSAELIEQAQSAGSSEADQVRRHEATRALVQRAGEARDALRDLATHGSDQAVRATAIQGLGKIRDKESVPLLLNALEDPNPYVRGQANAALIKVFEIDFGFQAEADPETRAAIVNKWRNAARNLPLNQAEANE